METTQSSKVQSWSTRQVVLATLVVASVLALFAFLYRFSNIIFILLITLVLSTGIRPVIAKLSRLGISRPVGVILLYLSGMLVLVILGILALPILTEQVSSIARELPNYYSSLRAGLFRSSSRLLTLLATQLPSELSLVTSGITNETGSITQVAKSASYAGLLARGVLQLIAILILAFYWTLESERHTRSLMLWLPADLRDRIRGYLAEIEDKVGGFIIGQSILCLVIGVVSFAAYALIGLPYTLVLALIAAIMEAVPVVGPALGAIPAILVAFSIDPTRAIWAIIAAAVIQVLENYLLVPRVMKRSVGVGPLVILLTIAAFYSLFGLAGAILSIPIAAIIQVSINHFVIQPAASAVTASDGRDQSSVLRLEVQNLALDVRKLSVQSEQGGAAPGHIVDTLEAIARDLDQLLANSETAKGSD